MELCTYKITSLTNGKKKEQKRILCDSFLNVGHLSSLFAQRSVEL